MLINDRTVPALHPDQLFADGLVYLNTAQWALAYAAFTQLRNDKKNQSPSLLYNMALCHVFAKEHQKAIAVLDEALMLLAAPSWSSQSAGHLPEPLLTQENQSNHHYLALNETAVILHTVIVKLRIRRLLVDLHLELQNWQEVLRLSSLPGMEKCKNVIEACTIAKTKINTSTE